MSFDKIFRFTLTWEGDSKLTNDPGDSGGVTKYGISSVENPDIDVPNLTEEDAKEIYYKRYWEPVAKGVDDNMDMAAFDSAVNCGVGTVKKWLPLCITWEDITAMRRKHYEDLAEEYQKDKKYLAGWINRDEALEAFIKKGG